VSKLPQLVYETKKDMTDSGLKSTIVGHVGDGMSMGPITLQGEADVCLLGNFHALMLFKDDEEFQKVSGAVHRLVLRALALDGTCLSYFTSHFLSGI